MEEAHQEALAIAEERWARIFNHNRPVAGRAHDPPDRKMVWGKPEDMAKHPDHEEHIRLWDLPCLSAMVTRVKAKLEAILDKTLHVMTQGYIESITHVRQLPHRDFPAASLPVDGIALSVFWALSMDIPDDEVCAHFVAMSTRAFPRPWIIHRMPMRRGSLWVIWSTVVHEGGGLPLAAEPGSRRIIGFCGLSTHTVSYATTHAITPPFWAHKAAVSCGVHGCRRRPTSEKCFGCGVQLQRPVTFRSFLRKQRLGLDPACLRLAPRVLSSLQPVFQGNQSCLHTCNGCLVLDHLFPCFALLLGCLLRGTLCPGLAATCDRLLNGIRQHLLQRRAHDLLQPRCQLRDHCPRVHCHWACPPRTARYAPLGGGVGGDGPLGRTLHGSPRCPL